MHSNPNRGTNQPGNPPANLLTANLGIRPSVLQPPSQMPNTLANSGLSKALAKPPMLQALVKPSGSPSGSSNPSPVPGSRPASVLTAPPPKSFLTMPKKLTQPVGNSINPTLQTQTSTSSNPPSVFDQSSKSNDLKDISLSNRSSVASELNHLTSVSNNNLDQFNGKTSIMSQESQETLPQQANFFSNSLPASAATSRLFASLNNASVSHFDSIKQTTNHSIDNLINQSNNSDSSSSVNQSLSLNNSLSSPQNNGNSIKANQPGAFIEESVSTVPKTVPPTTNNNLFNNNNNNTNGSSHFFQHKYPEISTTGESDFSANSQTIENQQIFPPQPPNMPSQQQNKPLQQQSFPPREQNMSPQQQSFPPHQQSFPPQQPNMPSQQQKIPLQQQSFPPHQQSFPPQQPNMPPQQNMSRRSIPQHPMPFETLRPSNQQLLQNQTAPNGAPFPAASSSNPSPFQPQQPMNFNNQVPQLFNGPPTNSLPSNIQPPPTGSMPPQNPINQNPLNLVKGPPTAAEIAQKVQQAAQQPSFANKPQTGPPLPNSQINQSMPPTNQFNNMDISGNSNQQRQTQQPYSAQFNNKSEQANTYARQPSSGQQNYNLGASKHVQSRSQPQSVDLMREKRLIDEYSDLNEPIKPQFPHEFYTNVNCHPDTIRCTLTTIPESQSLLSKCRLPLGILIHPFKDLESLKVVQSSTIVRCRNCRSYINPFVHFIDNTKWRCNLCYSINDLPDEFLFDPVTRSYGDPSKRPEINSSTIEFIAPAEYTLRPPPPAMYLYLLDVSHNAVTTGYLQSFCEQMLENLDKIPGDSRTQIGFITYNSALHFYNLCDSLSQPRMMIYPDLEDVTLPTPDSLMVNLNENKDSIQLFLTSLPSMFADTYETDSALGTALNAGFQLLKQTGGRMTVMQTCLPNLGVGSLKQRDENVDKDSANLSPQTDFYKKLALECAGVQIAVDLFMFNSQYADLATLSTVAKYSGGEIKLYPQFHLEKHPEQVIRFSVDFKRYLVRKIGFEAVMRIRCTRGLTIHTFHGNFFVRSTDLLALPNVNPDAGFGMQIAIEESLTDTPTVCFQAAVLYTSSKGERKIRIHTYCIPVSKNMNELMNSADQECIIGLVAKMAVDRTTMSSLKEAKDALINVASDYLEAYSQVVVSGNKNNSLISPNSLKMVPLLVLALMKNMAFKFGNIRLDERFYAMNLMKTMPLKFLMLCIYPHLYAVHNLDDRKVIIDSSETEICLPPRLHLSAESIDRHGVYIMDAGETIYMWVGRSVSDQFLQLVFDCKSFQELPDHSNDLPELDNILSERVRNFLVYLYDLRPFGPTFIFFREDSSYSRLFFQHMYDDKTESSVSYYEFLRHLQDQISG